MKNKLNILFPIEIINRELDFKLFLACICAKKTNRIFLGQHDAIYRLSKYIKNGLYVGKNFIVTEIPEIKMKRYQALKKNRIKIISLDEEGAVYTGDSKNWEKMIIHRLDPRHMQSDDYVCTWGDFQNSVYKKLNPKCINNIYTTGHPRFDLYKSRYRKYFESDVNKIKSIYNDFILVNTNLTLANNAFGLQDTFNFSSPLFGDLRGYDSSNNERRICFINDWAHQSKVLANLIKLINLISINFPYINVVIRPHPTEDINYYKIIFKNIDNIHVAHKGSVSPWLLACNILIHDGCTTAIEAYLAGKNIINYKSIVNKDFDIYLPNLFGIKCFTEEEVIKNINKMLDTPNQTLMQNELDPVACSLIDNFKNDSFEKVTNIINKAELEISESAQIYNRYSHKINESIYIILGKAKNIIRPLFTEKQMQYKFFTGQASFYGFEVKDIDQKLKCIQEILNKKIKCKFYSKELISIE